MGCFRFPQGAVFVLLCVACVYVTPFNNLLSPLISVAPVYARFAAMGLGVSFLLYPMTGLLADLIFTRYKVITASTVITSFSSLLFTAYIVLHVLNINLTLSIVAAILALTIFSFGMFETNIIQFGMDQLTEASGEQLSRFVHWFFWLTKFSNLCSSGVGGLLLLVLNYFWLDLRYNLSGVAIGVAILSLFFLLLAVTLICSKRRFLNVAQLRGNPLKNIFLVLRYSWQHKCPENRSAFTYWEEDVPARINLGKRKYGGPFTNEEVEDVKTFFKLSILLLSLFGVHLIGDTSSLSIQLEIQKGCPSIPALGVFMIDPATFSMIILLVVIPMYQTTIVQKTLLFLRLNMIRRMWLGLLFSALEVFSELIIFRANIQDWNGATQQHFNAALKIFKFKNFPMIKNIPTMFGCYHLQMKNQTELTEKGMKYTVEYSAYYWLLFPQMFHALSILLAFMTALEFICAQAPQLMQGLLIGLWYAMYSIRYLVVAVLDSYMIDSSSWYIYQGSKLSAILLSLLVYSCVARRYRYRERDEIINIQQMIEDIHERNYHLEEQYKEHQRRLFTENKRSLL